MARILREAMSFMRNGREKNRTTKTPDISVIKWANTVLVLTSSNSNPTTVSTSQLLSDKMGTSISQRAAYIFGKKYSRCTVKSIHHFMLRGFQKSLGSRLYKQTAVYCSVFTLCTQNSISTHIFKPEEVVPAVNEFKSVFVFLKFTWSLVIINYLRIIFFPLCIQV